MSVKFYGQAPNVYLLNRGDSAIKTKRRNTFFDISVLGVKPRLFPRVLLHNGSIFKAFSIKKVKNHPADLRHYKSKTKWVLYVFARAAINSFPPPSGFNEHFL